MDPNIKLSPIRPENDAFLFDVYTSTREDLDMVKWDAGERENFLRMQFTAQHRYYLEQFPDAQFDIIFNNDKPIGRLYVHRREDEIRIVDIALLPKHRNGGVGTLLLEDLLAEGERIGKPVRIHVEKFNPALHLYERLGFHEIGDTDIHFLMEWRPNGSDAKQPKE